MPIPYTSFSKVDVGNAFGKQICQIILATHIPHLFHEVQGSQNDLEDVVTKGCFMERQEITGPL